ncbi:anti-sigma regulatory factor, serine/threonine protein kinase [Caldicellulosiruptor acetigenus I77R1B]|uniref:Anti-sigma regulatory factor, serine/threonine protein kinase n=1 Tax=Caldicellulosiruptor acetigenus (strain ATCC 700853 / DSM 12137 / I77R1B) TaxID=632335 RepID=E4SAG1_CALA7|nr:anti-sigma F factor [Caldicellulosiruptor acetigenus]ADQ41186.1 anti-sigma regulatory factor, serine/threonine protein kinase [Caldicellulosiruptor acetigenus I77R1B]WAM37222.1 anti-sigma F factor [Caldicellulosiruptor acetigenus]
MKVLNYMELKIPSKAQNEAFARVAVAAFVAQLDPTLDEVTEIKTAVSEAVTNSIIHAYEDKIGEIIIKGKIYENYVVEIEVIDFGKGIEDVELARQPLFTTKPDQERSGMGFTVMETFMDKLEVTSEVGKGTCVRMFKAIKKRKSEGVEIEQGFPGGIDK